MGGPSSLSGNKNKQKKILSLGFIAWKWPSELSNGEWKEGKRRKGRGNEGRETADTTTRIAIS